MFTSFDMLGHARLWLAAAALTVLTACETLADPAPNLIIENVTVLSMVEGAAPLRDVSVVISGDRITRIAPSGQVSARPNDQRIDGRGRYLMPGLADMHAHPENALMLGVLTGGGANAAMTAQETEDVFLPFIAHGVTQILNMSANADAIVQRAAVERGDIIGPHMALASMVDGAPRLSPFGTEVSGPDAGAAFVREARAAGYDFVKVYSQLDVPTFNAIAAEARRQNIRIIGHIPGRGANAPERFLPAGLTLVGHAEEFAFQGATVAQSVESIPAYVALLSRTGSALTSTLTLDERIVAQARAPESINARSELRYLAPPVRGFWTLANPYTRQGPGYADFVSSIVAFNAQMVRACYEAGVPVLPGTDANVPGVAPGSSLHDELAALSRAGLPNRTILESATRRAAEFLGVMADRGTIEVGKRADLVLLDADPLADIANTRRIAAVILSGRMLPASDLAARMDALAARRAGRSMP